jgi:hypothetical protein
MRKPIAIAIAIAAALAVLAPTAAPAQEEPQLLSSVSILSSVVDVDRQVVTVTVSVTCLMDVPYDVGPGYAQLTQSEGSGRVASFVTKAFGANGCLAGQVLVFPLRFGGTHVPFLPGPAVISGVIVATLACPPCLDDDEASIGPATVILRPV